MKVKTRELVGAALDWGVIVAEHGKHDANNPRHIEHFKNIRRGHPLHQQAHYSTNWAHGGPIIERERINVERGNDLIFPKGNEKGDYCEPLWLVSQKGGRKFHGQTPLMAAMRCYVASKFGDEVEVPDELCS